MFRNVSITIYLSGCLLCSASPSRILPDLETDVCILGGSEAAFTSAIQSARLGKNVVLIEPTGHPGGMMVEGIAKDIRFGSSIVIGGIAREIYTAIEASYGRTPHFDQIGWSSHYEPSIASSVIESALASEKNIHIIRGSRIYETDGVKKKGPKIDGIVLENGQRIHAAVYIDASIEGHLLHLAGISTETIREGNHAYGESKNGIQNPSSYRQFEIKVDPYRIPGDSTSGLIASIQEGEIGTHGDPDPHVQGYCFRLVLTRDPQSRIPIEKPSNYDPADYEIYRRYLKAGGTLFQPHPSRPNGKTDLGSWHDLSANLYGENKEYPNGNYATQERIVARHKNFTQGLIWFLQNDPEVDAKTQENWENWGLCKDEFTDNQGWPHRLYVRSARRMLSDFVLTEKHARRDNPQRIEDPVAIAWWPPDSHHARRIVKDGYAYNEGFVFGGDDWRPFGVSLRALYPDRNECINLISPTCPSSSYVAYSAIRILPTFMILGQSAGYAASLAIDKQCAVQDLDYQLLREGLLKSGQILDRPQNWLAIISASN